ncbi:MAG: hypothetical protein ACK4S0_15995, partial [Sediminibacterium sp.]
HLADGIIQFIKNGNIDYFDKVMQFMQPPRILLTGISFFFSVIYLLIKLIWPGFYEQLALDFQSWFTILVISSFILLINTPKRFYSLKTISALLYLPSGFFLMLKSLLKIKGASKKFIHTTHEHTDHDIKKRGTPS